MQVHSGEDSWFGAADYIVGNWIILPGSNLT
jgi:hypothetical protein